MHKKIAIIAIVPIYINTTPIYWTLIQYYIIKVLNNIYCMRWASNSTQTNDISK